MSKFIDILEEKDNFPRIIPKKQGEILKNEFKLDREFMERQNDKNDMEYRYFKEVNGEKYILIVEYLFKDGEPFLKIENAIDVNYYLNRK